MSDDLKLLRMRSYLHNWIAAAKAGDADLPTAVLALMQMDGFEMVEADEITRLRAEVDRLREAMRLVEQRAENGGFGSSYIICYTCVDNYHAARAALGDGNHLKRKMKNE